MTPRPEDAPAVIAATPAAACSPPGDQATSRPTTTDAKWGQFRPSRWGHCKSSFSLGEGKAIPEAAKELGISEQTYHRWRNRYGGMKANEAKRLKELERENQQLKRIVADQVLENQALKEIARGNW